MRNFVDPCVYWKGSPDVALLTGRTVRLHIELKRAKPYAFQFTNE